jgi:hypothetical protein
VDALYFPLVPFSVVPFLVVSGSIYQSRMVIQKAEDEGFVFMDVQFHVSFSFHSIHFQRLFLSIYQSRNGYSKGCFKMKVAEASGCLV